MANKRGRSGSKKVKRPAKRVRIAAPVKKNGLKRRVPSTRIAIGRKKLRRGRPSRRRVIGKTGAEYQKTVVRYGRPPRLTFSQLNRLALMHRTLEFKGLNAFERSASGAGRYGIGSTILGDANVYNHYLPVYAFCLNSTINGSASATPHQRLVYSKNGGTYSYSWSTETGTLGQGVVSDQWSIQKLHAYSALTHRRLIAQNWYDIRLLLHNAKTQPTRFQIDIVKFSEDWVDPMNMKGNPTFLGHQVEDQMAFYSTIARRLINNPIYDGGQMTSKTRMKVLKSMIVNMQPNYTTDLDQSPNHREIRMFYSDGRVYDYAPYELNPPGNEQILNPQFANESGEVLPNQYRTLPKPKARLYLLVRAMDPTYTASFNVEGAGGLPDAADNTDNTPSFDLVVRKSESTIS